MVVTQTQSNINNELKAIKSLVLIINFCRLSLNKSWSNCHVFFFGNPEIPHQIVQASFAEDLQHFRDKFNALKGFSATLFQASAAFIVFHLHVTNTCQVQSSFQYAKLITGKYNAVFVKVCSSHALIFGHRFVHQITGLGPNSVALDRLPVHHGQTHTHTINSHSDLSAI